MRRPGKEVSVLHCWWLTLGSHHLAPLLQRLAFRTRQRLGMQENLSPALQPECTGFSGKALLRRRREEEPREEGMLVYGLLTSRLCKEQQVPLNSLSEAETQTASHARWTPTGPWTQGGERALESDFQVFVMKGWKCQLPCELGKALRSLFNPIY